MSSTHTEGLQIITVNSQDAECVVCLEGELDVATAEPVRTCLRELGDRPVVIDLTGLTFTHSTGLALLLEARAEAWRRGAALQVRGAAGQTRELLERTGVLDLLARPADLV